MEKPPAHNKTPRPPVVAVMGHIDHGKSTLLDYIRSTNIVDKEAGGITQHISSYEVEHVGKDGEKHLITFLDTPGHEAFSSVRTRGAKAADIAILVVAADDGVNTQTRDALTCIQTAGLPFIVAINKIDKPSANIEKAKQSLAEADVYVEGYGGNISWAPISAKTGEGIPDLLDLVLLTAELEEFTGNRDKKAEGVIIESNLDQKKGISATLIIKDGTLKKGMALQSGSSYVPLRSIENYQGKNIDEASFSSPVRITGWSELPRVGEIFYTFDTKKEALKAAEQYEEPEKEGSDTEATLEDSHILPIAIKGDTAGSIDAVKFELKKWNEDRLIPKIIYTGIGTVTENDILLVSGKTPGVVLGFNVKIDEAAKRVAEQYGVTIGSFDIIYKLTEWFEEEFEKRIPRSETEVPTGTLKILKVFSKHKDKQVVGGRVTDGELHNGKKVNVYRRDNKIGIGTIRELQKMKQKSDKVQEGDECGLMIDSRVEIVPGDHIEGFNVEIR